MRTKSSFNLVSLVVVIVLITLLSFALFPAISSSVLQANMTAVGARGKDIYVAITGANTEREPLGLPPVWPAEPGLYADTEEDDISSFNFTNSTDYFWELNDGDNLGTEDHSPYVAGFDYRKLAGSGIELYSGSGPLLPDNNIWTIAKNIRDEMPDIVPILFTRNLAAESLATSVTNGESARELYFDHTEKFCFSNKGAVLIRKGGGMFKVSRRYMNTMVIYQKQSFDVNVLPDGEQSKFPLKYLTPTHEVTPSEETYSEGKEKHKLTDQDRRYYIKQALPKIISGIVTGFIQIALIYLICFVVGSISRCISKSRSKFEGLGCLYWVCHWLAVSFYCLVLAGVISLKLWGVVPLFLAILMQYAGCKYVNYRKEKLEYHVSMDSKTWLLVAPLLVFGVFGVMFLCCAR